MKFKPGDTVKCIEGSSDRRYIKGKIYIVAVDIRNNARTTSTVLDELGHTGNAWFTKNFKLVGKRKRFFK